MKIWFEHCRLDGYFEDCDVKFGIGWYRHHKDHKWFGFTIHFYLLHWVVVANYVNNWAEYDKKINYRKYRDKK